MDQKGRVLLLVGSPRGIDSTSHSLGSYLLERLADMNFDVSRFTLYLALRKEERLDELLAATDRADLIILAFPLYVDSLPAAVIRVLELIAERRLRKPLTKKQRLVAICNSGFPESSQSNTAIGICRRFAREAGLEWAGGLALGGGEAIHGRALPEVGSMAKNIVKSLDLAAIDLATHGEISQQAMELMSKPFVPAWLYRMLGDHGFRKDARKHGVTDLDARPYER